MSHTCTVYPILHTLHLICETNLYTTYFTIMRLNAAFLSERIRSPWWKDAFLWLHHTAVSTLFFFFYPAGHNAEYIYGYTMNFLYLLPNWSCGVNKTYACSLSCDTIDSSGVGHKDCPHRPLHTPSTPPVQQQHQLTLAPQATLRLTGGVPGKVGLHQTTYVCSVYFFTYPSV